MKIIGDVSVEMAGHLGMVEIKRPPHNYFDKELIGDLADAFEYLDTQDSCRVSILSAEGKSFCAGGVFAGAIDVEKRVADAKILYANAARMFKTHKPIVAAIEGAAIGGGLGVALVADFRIACEDARFSANFTKLGIHAGFGLSMTLPRLIGEQKANLMFYTGLRVKGVEALEWGLVDHLVSRDRVRETAHELATEIANCAPLAIQSMRKTIRSQMVNDIIARMDHELAEQARLFATRDFAEGAAAVRERRAASFIGS